MGLRRVGPRRVGPRRVGPRRIPRGWPRRVRPRRVGPRRVQAQPGKNGAPKGAAPKGGAPKGGRPNISRFFSLSRHHFALFVSIWVSARGILLVFLKARTLQCARLEFSGCRVKPVRKRVVRRKVVQGSPNQQQPQQPQPQQRQTQNKWAPKGRPLSQARFRVWVFGTGSKQTTTNTNNNTNTNTPKMDWPKMATTVPWCPLQSPTVTPWAEFSWTDTFSHVRMCSLRCALQKLQLLPKEIAIWTLIQHSVQTNITMFNCDPVFLVEMRTVVYRRTRGTIHI